MAPKFQTAITINKTKLSDHVYHFVFQQQDPFIFKCGQYISVKVADSRINAYSVAGQNKPNRFELLVDISPGGPGSKYFENLKINDEILYIGPLGIFTYKPDDGAKKILFLATSTGCAPLKVIIEYCLKQLILKIPMTLYFGVRHNNDIFLYDYFVKLSQDFPNFSFKLVLSKPDSDWHGLTGHITDFIKKDHPDAGSCSAYLCGNTEMINEAKKILAEIGTPKERMYFEPFI